MSNRSEGTGFEQEFCEILFNNGFWAHNIAQKAAGQPSDIIAIRGEKAFLIDCKVCSRDYFRLSRIEENQESSMTLWENRSVNNAWFALKMADDRIYMISFRQLISLRSQNYKSVTKSMLSLYANTLEEWLEDDYIL